MNNILKAWNAGFVRRWHTQPRLCDTVDYTSGHAQRCTVLLLLFWPDSSRDSIIDTLTHDQGEDDSGDIARPAKQAFPKMRDMASDVERASIETQGLNLSDPSEEEILRRKFVDLLDSYLWMLRHKPSMQHRPEWKEQYELLRQWSHATKVYPQWESFIYQAGKFYE